MIVSFYKIKDYCSKNLPKVLLVFSFTAISSISPEANTDEYKKHSKASQNPLRLNIYIHLFRYIPDLLETHFSFHYETVSIRISGYLKRPLLCL